MKRKILLAIVGWVALSWWPKDSCAQNYLPPRPQTYTEYYNKQLKTYHRPPTDVRNYTIDKYFYHRPTLSPYLNLGRRTGPNTLNNYYKYVRPEVQRRSQGFAPSSTPRVPNSFNSNPYFNQVYKPIHP